MLSGQPFKITYKNQELTQFKPKSGGKNQSPVDGFYRDAANPDDASSQFFVKKPEVMEEFFTELFAGKLIQKFKQKGWISAENQDSLIVADIVKLADGSYALIQPSVKFKELFKWIHWNGEAAKDRDVTSELVMGTRMYPQALQAISDEYNGNFRGLALSIMISQLLGAFSVHSANMVVLAKKDKDIPLAQYGRIDWGDAFRDYNDPKNSDVMYPAEYIKSYFKGTTKGYISFYQYVGELFSKAIPSKANKLKKDISSADVLKQVILEVIDEMPVDLLTADERVKVAKYMSMPSVGDALCGNKEANENFAGELTGIMFTRLENICKLETTMKPAAGFGYTSVTLAPRNIQLSVDGDETEFKLLLANVAAQIAADQDALNPQSEALVGLKIEHDNLTHLAKCYNQSVSALLSLAEAHGVWNSNAEENMLSGFQDNVVDETSSYEFIPQLKDRVILERLFIANPATLKSRFENTASYAAAQVRFGKLHPDSEWQQIYNVLQVGQVIIQRLKYLNNLSQKDVFTQQSVIKELVNSIVEASLVFSNTYDALTKKYLKKPVVAVEQKSSFYTISLEKLQTLSSNQLMSICIEEFFKQDSPVFANIIDHTLIRNKLLDANKDKFSANDQLLIPRIIDFVFLCDLRDQESFDALNAKKELKAVQDNMELQNKEMQQKISAAEKLTEAAQAKTLTAERQQEEMAFKPLLDAIGAMQTYGTILNGKGVAKGEAVLTLANQALTDVQNFRSNKSNFNEESFNAFKELLLEKLNKQNDTMGKYRFSLGTIIANIVIALTGIGALIIAGKLIHSKVMTGRANFLFSSSRTTSEIHLDKVKKKLNKLPLLNRP